MRAFTTSAVLFSGALAAVVSLPGTPVTVADLELRQVPTTTTATSSSLPNAAAAAQETTTTTANPVAATTTSALTGTSTTTALSSSTSSSMTTTAVVNPLLTSTSTSPLPTLPSSTNPTNPTTLATATSTTTTAAGAANPATITSAAAAAGTTTKPDPLDANTWITTKWSPQTDAAGATIGWTQGVHTQTWAAVPDQLPAAGSGRIGFGQYDGDSVVAAAAATTGKGGAESHSGAAGLIGADRVLGVVIVAVMVGMGLW